MADSPPAPALMIDSAAISYGAFNVLRGVGFQVVQGETFGLIGLNGAGKTTLIKAILGLRNLDSGAVQVFGHDCKTIASRRHYAYLPERFDPPWFLSGMEFIRFSLSLYKTPFAEDAVRAAARAIGLDPTVLGRRMQTYSKGMRQKLGLLGTILTGCGLLILDEPMSGLDPRARVAVKDMLLDTKKQGRTIFLSSHILSDMDEICDRIGVLHAGRLVFIGKPENLRQQTGQDRLERAFLALIDTQEPATHPVAA